MAGHERLGPGDVRRPRLISGGFGDDELFGEPGDDSVFGNEDADVIFGNFGSDNLVGGTGNDFIDGDNSFAGPFPSPIDTNPHTDTCSGGKGTDPVTNCEAGPSGGGGAAG